MGTEADTGGRDVRERIHLIANPLVRHDAVQRLESFLIAAVATILVIRTQLWLTNYPQLGGNGLHIAHLLWGGLFMLVAIWVALIYLNRRALAILAVLGGIGFGFFIDELGKFITSDNDYFFRPAAALIYVILVLLFLGVRELSRRQRPGPRSALANALSYLPATLSGEFGPGEHRTVTELLDQADRGDPQVEAIRQYFERVSVAPVRPPSRLFVRVEWLRSRLTALTRRPRFGRAVIVLMTIWGFLAVVNFVLVIFAPEGIETIEASGQGDFVTVASAISTAVSGLLILTGVIRMRRGQRQRAYRDFRRALLVSIFITRVFSFVESQFGAVFGLGMDLVFYSAIGALATSDARDQEGRPGPARRNEGDGEAET